MITDATITLAQTHFCRDDALVNAIAGTVTLTGSVSDPYTLKLSRRGYEAGTFTLKTEEKVLQIGEPDEALPFSYPLSSLVDAAGMYAAPCSRMRGDYAIEVLVSGVPIATATFSVAPFTVVEMRNRWARGLPLSGTTYTTTDDDILEIILHAYHRFAHGLGAYPEPVRIVSPLLVEKGLVTAYDRVLDAVMYAALPSRNTWMSIPLPPRLLTVHSLDGWLNQEETVTFSRDWITINEQSGLVQLVPSNAAIIQWTFYGPGFYLFFASRSHLPNFWQFEVTAGGRRMQAVHGEYIARSAAIELLSQVSQALYPRGGSSLSISRDGVSESRNINPLGAYASLIGQYERLNGIDKEGKEKGIRDLRRRFVGIPMAVL